MPFVIPPPAFWALFGDSFRRRFRRRRRCPRCWYDLTHTEGLRCNECGHEVRRERQLFRARRRWGIATLAALASGEIYWAITFSALIRGMWWWWAIPILFIGLIFVGLLMIAAGLDELANPKQRKAV